MVTGSIIAIYVADKILEHFIQEEAGYKRWIHFLFPPKKFRTRLIEIIELTTTEFELSHPCDSTDRFPFYKSQVFFDRLNSFILFGKNSFEGLESEFKNFPKIIEPSEQELGEFYSLFVGKLQGDDELRRLYIKENYKELAFQAYSQLQSLFLLAQSIKEDTSVTRGLLEDQRSESEAKKLTSQKVLQSLASQVNRQLKKQIATEKYLRNTFVETGAQKDMLRYLCDSVFFAPKCFEEIEILDFRVLNSFLIKKNQALFDLDLRSYKQAIENLNLNNVGTTIRGLESHLSSKKEELLSKNLESNDKWKFERKFRDRGDLEFLRSKLSIITEGAGQGKTNLLCDFVENFLLTRGIPVVFLTGVEIDATDIRKSILKKVFPNDDTYGFSEFMTVLKSICHEQQKYFVIIVDGINENLNPKSLSTNLESFIAEAFEFDFVKIVLSCRTEYFDFNFSNLEKSSFSGDARRIRSLLNHASEDNLKKKLLEIYFHHFKISYSGIHDKAYGQLVTSFLLLRIFCEAYKNKQLGYIENIYKEELFENYFSVKTKEIDTRLGDNDELGVSGSIDVKAFLVRMIEYMIDNKTYVNVPLATLLRDVQHRDIYVRFLDENILVRKDLQSTSKGIFDDEVVNFTFDEFRDFLISRYLIESLYKKSTNEFSEFLTDQITPKSAITEGCSTFLFFISKKKGDPELQSIIEMQDWYSQAFAKCIFSLRDNQVTEEDKERIRDILATGNPYAGSVILNLIVRYDPGKYVKLNINFLFAFLNGLNEDQFDKCFVDKFGEERWGNAIDQGSLIHQIAELIRNKSDEALTRYNNLFEVLIYMFTNHEKWEIQATYEQYYFRNSAVATEQLKRVLEHSRNEKLKQEIKRFIKRYEIKL